MSDQVVLIDAKNFCYRNHWVHRLLQSRGRPTSVLFGCFKTLAALASRIHDTPFVFVWDGKPPTWRHRLTKGTYKANRIKNEEFEIALEQIPEFQWQLHKIGFRQFHVDGLEADDLIGVLTTVIINRNLFDKVVIHSTDEDFYQLTNGRVGVLRGYDKERDEHPLLFGEDIERKIDLHPSDWIKVRALTGETTDNIPKIEKGLGPKTAIKMIMAGLDPSVETFDKLNWSARCNFARYSVQWARIKQNYKLSRIITSADDENLGEEKKVLIDLTADISRQSFLRDKDKLTDDGFAQFTDFIMDYEMKDLFDERVRLWKMP